MRMMLNRRDNGEDGKTENTQGRPDKFLFFTGTSNFPTTHDSILRLF